MPIQEKIPHEYTFTGKDLREALKLTGVVTSISASPYVYEDEKSKKTKTAYKITVHTMERKPDSE